MRGPFFIQGDRCTETLSQPLWAKNRFLSTGLRSISRAMYHKGSEVAGWDVCCGNVLSEFDLMEILNYTKMDSPVGPLFLAASGQGLVALEFDARLPGQQSIRPNPRHLREERQDFRFEDSLLRMQPYRIELEEYFSG